MNFPPKNDSLAHMIICIDFSILLPFLYTPKIMRQFLFITVVFRNMHCFSEKRKYLKLKTCECEFMVHKIAFMESMN